MQLFRCVLASCCLLHQTVWADSNQSHECLLDLKALPEFILNNDAGGKDIFQEKGELYFSTALQKSEQKIASVMSSNDCQSVLRDYLHAWRKGHLEIDTLDAGHNNVNTAAPEENLNVQSKPNPQPEINFLSSKTLVLRLPDFSPSNRQSLIDLLEKYRRKLARTPNWIIDVRGNGGGADSSYKPLLPWVLENETQDIGASWLATPDNIKGQRSLCARFAPGDADCISSLEEAATRMENKPVGSFVPQGDGPLITHSAAEKHPHPKRVALVIDQGCGSSCEEFVLKLRQSFNVKTIGTRTHGSLDYSNLRSYLLPSGKRELWYATSRSNRLPDFKVDGSGIMADIYFPVPKDERDKNLYLPHIKNWLEGGSLAADNDKQEKNSD